MDKISKNLIESPIWIISILISIISIIFFIYLPFQIDFFPEGKEKKVYYVDNISKAHFKIIKQFNEIHDGEIEVVPVNLPFHSFTTNDRKAIITRSLRNKSDGIDIFAVDLIWVPRFAKWAYPLDNRINDSLMSNIFEPTLDACFQEDKMVAFPHFLDVGVLYYRRDIINSLPNGKVLEQKIKNSLTWKEFIELGNTFKDKKYPYFVFGGGDYEGLLCNFFERLSMPQIKDIFSNPIINLNTTYAERSLNQLYDFIYKYKFTPKEVVGFDGFESYTYTVHNDVVFLRGWIGYHKHYASNLDDTSNVKHLAIAPLPHFEGNETSGVFGGWPLMISKHSTKKDEALKFLEYIFSKESQMILYNEGGYLPVNNEVYADSAFALKHPELKNLAESLKWAKHRPFLRNYTSISEIMSKSFHEALKDEISVKEALYNSTKHLLSDQVVFKK